MIKRGLEGTRRSASLKMSKDMSYEINRIGIGINDKGKEKRAQSRGKNGDWRQREEKPR